MEVGVFLPISGRAATADTLREAAQTAAALGFDAVWAADRIVIPWKIRSPYPYSSDQKFIVPPDRPFLEPLTCLAYLAACTERIKIGMSVLVLPYRHPVTTAKIAASLDHLSKGRFILGVGSGWMREEFEALNVPFGERGKMTDEQLEVLTLLWREEKPSYRGKYHRFHEIAFEPKPWRQSRVPIWVGGEKESSQRRAAKFGDAWFPYFVRITPKDLREKFHKVRKYAEEAKRDPDSIQLACCLPIELMEQPASQRPGQLHGNPEQLTSALTGFKDAGVRHLALQFMVPRWPERKEQIARFAREVLPALK